MKYFFLITLLLISLLWWKWPHIRAAFAEPPKTDYTETTTETGSYRKAYFAAGCFWCSESSFEHYNGVIDAVSGYAGGTETSPTYEQVSHGQTHHREAIEVVYDPKIIGYNDLLEIFWRTADPTDTGGQYVDRGPQYTPAIWYQDETEKSLAEASKSRLEASGRFGSGKLSVPILAFTTFYPAEDYHQNYYKTNPFHYKLYTNGSGRREYQEKIWGADYQYTKENTQSGTSYHNTPMTKEQLKEKLTPIQYEVTQEEGTERPFSNEYWDNKRAGIYVDIVDGKPLFSSIDKYDSGTGWPSFVKPIDPNNVEFKEDKKLWSTRTEVHSKYAQSHLGHVFDDGPADKGGKRYCMNSASMRFIPVEDLEKEGYGEWRSLFEKK